MGGKKKAGKKTSKKKTGSIEKQQITPEGATQLSKELVKKVKAKIGEPCQCERIDVLVDQKNHEIIIEVMHPESFFRLDEKKPVQQEINAVIIRVCKKKHILCKDIQHCKLETHIDDKVMQCFFQNLTAIEPTLSHHDLENIFSIMPSDQKDEKDEKDGKDGKIKLLRDVFLSIIINKSMLTHFQNIFQSDDPYNSISEIHLCYQSIISSYECLHKGIAKSFKDFDNARKISMQENNKNESLIEELNYLFQSQELRPNQLWLRHQAFIDILDELIKTQTELHIQAKQLLTKHVCLKECLLRVKNSFKDIDQESIQKLFPGLTIETITSDNHIENKMECILRGIEENIEGIRKNLNMFTKQKEQLCGKDTLLKIEEYSQNYRLKHSTLSGVAQKDTLKYSPAIFQQPIEPHQEIKPVSYLTSSAKNKPEIQENNGNEKEKKKEKKKTRGSPESGQHTPLHENQPGSTCSPEQELYITFHNDVDKKQIPSLETIGPGIYITACASEAISRDRLYPQFEKTIERAKLLARDGKGQSGIKIHNENLIAVKIRGGQRLICISHTIGSQNEVLFIPYQILEHDNYQKLLNDPQRTLDITAKAHAELEIHQHQVTDTSSLQKNSLQSFNHKP